MSGRDQSVDSVEELLQRHGARLRSLLGHSIQAVWVAWDNQQDAWFADEAVVIDVGRTQLEVACWKLSDIILSWDSIDLRQAPGWVAEWTGFDLTWKKNVPPVVAPPLLRPITGVSVIEYMWRTTVVVDHKNPGNIGRQNECWLMHGLELECSGTSLIVFNDLDKNGLAAELPKGLEVRKTPIM